MARKQPTDKPADPTGEPIGTAAAPGTPVAGMNYLVALNILTPERRDAILDPNL